MAMSFQDACKIVLMRHKLFDLRDKAPDAQIPAIDAQLARLRPYAQEAADLVMKQTDANFAAVAKSLSAQIKPINDAITNIKKISAAIAAAAQIISAILSAVGAVTGVP